MKRALYILLMCIPSFIFGQTYEINWHNEAADTTRITELLKEGATKKFDTPSAAVSWYAKKFIDTPYVAHTLEGEEEMLTVNLDELDCTTFVELALALAFTTEENRQNWQDFTYNLKRMRYRGGEIDGYSSRLHYICDWAIDNIHRGNIVDVTRNIPSAKDMIKTIDFMTANRGSYPSLKDSVQFERIKNIENGYHNHKFPYIKTSDLANKETLKYLREGDIVAFVSTIKNLDVTHLGILVRDGDGKLKVLHASSTDGKVEISDSPLPQFVKRNPKWAGARFFRLKE